MRGAPGGGCGRIETSGWEEWNITGTRQAEELQEELLDGWLQMSTVICNERLVSAMTYNESMVCGVLHRNRQKRVTATDLCAKLRILKPQMNAILNGLQNRGMLERIRSEADRRQVYLQLTKEGCASYERAHQELLALPQGLIEQLGEEKMRQLAGLMHEVAEKFPDISEEVAGKE